MTSRGVDKNDCTDKYRDLYETCKTGEQSGDDEWPAKNMRKDDIMRQHSACEPRGYSWCSVLQFIHVRDELETFESNEDA